MKRSSISKIIAVIVVILFPTLVYCCEPPDEVKKAEILSKTYRMQIPFIENQGQIENEDISFYAINRDVHL
jgi:hypothetical protein